MITLELPWAPTANTYYRRVGNKTLISRAGREYRKQIGKQRMAEKESNGKPGHVAVAVREL